jgi:hypothetical protein
MLGCYTYASLNVEDTTITPAVLVITNESTVWISGKSSLAGTGKTEEDSDIAVLALVGRGVKGQDVVLDWHLVEENGEDTLLHLTSILGTQDNHLLLSEVDRNRSSRGHTLGVSVSWERTSIVDGVIWVEVLKVFALWANEHVAHEQCMVGSSTDDADLDAVLLVPSGKTIDDVDAISGVEVINCTLTVDSPDLLID